MKKDRIPRREECFELMKENMLPNIYEHSIQVMNVAKAIIDNLNDRSIVNEDLIITASLLHDICKTESLETKEPHDIKGAEFARKLGFYSIADIIKEHIILREFNPQGKLLEKEIVYYSDKRVMHEKIVSVEERIEDIIERYGKSDEIIERIKVNTSLILDVEEKINKFSRADVKKLF